MGEGNWDDFWLFTPSVLIFIFFFELSALLACSLSVTFFFFCATLLSRKEEAELKATMVEKKVADEQAMRIAEMQQKYRREWEERAEREKEEERAERKKEWLAAQKESAKWDDRKKVLKKREEVAKSRKESAFSGNNFQAGHGRIGMSQRDKVWEKTSGVCRKCLQREEESNPKAERKSMSWDEWSEKNKTIGRENSFNAYTDVVSFYWTIHPSLEVVLMCDECATEDGLLETQPESERRSRHISQDVKDRVWNRDGGECVECGSKEELQFDHVIPHSKGGSNGYANIQLLCGRCNRRKSDTIG